MRRWNRKEIDGCSSNCYIEAGYTCSGSIGGISTCTEICGDGKVMGSNECDDNNILAGDGCSATC